MATYSELYGVNDDLAYLQIDDAAVAALELFDSSTDSATKASGFAYNMYGVLNKCRTPGGRRLLKEWLRKPLCDLARISERHDVVDALNEASECRDQLHRQLLRQVPDVALLCRKLGTRKASLEDCYKLYRCVNVLHEIGHLLQETCGEDASLDKLVVKPLKNSATELDKFRQLISSTVDQDPLSGAFRIRPDVDETLRELNEKIQHLQTKAATALTSLKKAYDCDGAKLDSNTEVGFYFRVTLKSEKTIRGANFNVFETTKGGGVKFTNSALQSLNAEYLELFEGYSTGQEELTRHVVDTSAGYTQSLEQMAEHLALLDALLAFSVLCSTSANAYVRPELLPLGERVFELTECRHPVLECAPFAASFIPNDCKFEGRCRFVILSGANMGGKSTYLRSAALTVILAQCGCFVPCDKARFALIDRVLTRVGAEDYQYKGVSTFMAEMEDCKRILDQATANSLVVIDELGRGTSTYDGFGLAWAIGEEIIRKGCFALFATHFHEMAAMQQQHEGVVQNLKVDTHLSNDGVMTILYKISPGVAEKSFGLAIARMVGFPEEVVQNAQSILEKLESGTSVSAEEHAARQLLRSCSQMNASEVRYTLSNLPEEAT